MENPEKLESQPEQEQKLFEHKISDKDMSVEWIDEGFRFVKVNNDGEQKFNFTQYDEISKKLREFYMNSFLYCPPSTSNKYVIDMINFSYLSTRDFDYFKKNLEIEAEKEGKSLNSIIDNLPQDSKEKFLIMDALFGTKEPEKDKIENFIKNNPSLTKELIEYSLRKNLVYPEFGAGSRLITMIGAEELSAEVLILIKQSITPEIEKLIDIAVCSRIEDTKEMVEKSDNKKLLTERIQEAKRVYTLLGVDISQKEFLK